MLTESTILMIPECIWRLCSNVIKSGVCAILQQVKRYPGGVRYGGEGICQPSLRTFLQPSHLAVQEYRIPQTLSRLFVNL